MKNNNWILVSDEIPNSGERCLVTDGDVVVIATYIIDSDNRKFWIFSSNAGEREDKTFNVQAWDYLPKPPEKLVKVSNETTVAKNKATD